MTRELPVISVVTVCRNDLSGLRDTLIGVTNQSYDRVEHIVVDGASTDGTAEFLSGYQSEPSVNWTSEADEGIFDAMNKGVNRATGDVIVFMNAGDGFTDDSTLEFVAGEWALGSWEWGYGAMRYRTMDGDLIGGAIQSPFQARRFQLGFRFVPHQSMYISRSLFKMLDGYDVGFSYACDQELAMRAAAASAPATWVRFMSDFTTGGVHSQSSELHREMLIHRMRAKNGSLIAGSRLLDLAFVVVVSAWRHGRRRLAKSVAVR